MIKTEALTVRPLTAADLDAVMEIYARAREYMKKSGNPTQWGDRHPPRELIERDVEDGTGFVCVGADGRIHGVFAFIEGEDPTYVKIDGGSWASDAPYGAIHRIAGDGEAGGVFAACFEFCRSRCAHLRIDTHEDNAKMRRLLEKYGFSYRGTIYISDGAPRRAYEYPAQ